MKVPEKEMLNNYILCKRKIQLAKLEKIALLD